ncbi:hypothetical protein COO60DRAFT_1054532 [Scenedesmus sp. NREL 46B-D3]|nr:hypothetical protein COO60DRAFT_1054532 [Scenedesmus sp. NREL 46B-D3]
MPPPPPPEPLYVLRGHRAAVQCVAFLPGCSALAAGDGEGELKLWDLDSRRVTASIRAHESHSGVLQVACPTPAAAAAAAAATPQPLSGGARELPPSYCVIH